MSKEKIDFSKIKTECDGDIIFVTVAKYKLFLSYGKIGMDSYLLYSHLIFTARLQQTNTVKANNIYIRQGLKWTKERLNKAKNLLFDLSLIKQIKRRDKLGKIVGWYLEVKTKTSPFEFKDVSTDLENETVDKPVGWESDPKCLNEEVNALTKKEKTTAKDGIHQQVLKTFATTYKSLYGEKMAIGGREGSEVKKIIAIAQESYNGTALAEIEKRIEVLKGRAKSGDKFWKFTTGKLLLGWNELVEKKVNPHGNNKRLV